MRARLPQDPQAFRDNATSCAICLEAFTPQTAPVNHDSETRATETARNHSMDGDHVGSVGSNNDIPANDETSHLLPNDRVAFQSSASVPPVTPGPGNGTAATAPVLPLQLQCGHKFCEGCISEWMREHNNCPVCRQSAGLDGSGRGGPGGPEGSGGPGPGEGGGPGSGHPGTSPNMHR